MLLLYNLPALAELTSALLDALTAALPWATEQGLGFAGAFLGAALTRGLRPRAQRRRGARPPRRRAADRRLARTVQKRPSEALPEQ